MEPNASHMHALLHLMALGGLYTACLLTKMIS